MSLGSSAVETGPGWELSAGAGETEETAVVGVGAWKGKVGM